MRQVIYALCCELGVDTTTNGTRDALIPTMPFENIKQQVSLELQKGHMVRLGFRSPTFVGVIQVGSESSEETQIVCFQRASDPLNEYSEQYLTYLAEGKPYFLEGGVHVHAISPSFGTYESTMSREKILICTPCFKRPEILEIYCAYMIKYFIPQLIMEGFDVCLTLCGGDEEREVALKFSDAKELLFFWQPNDLGLKKNVLFELAQNANFDYAVTIDSDDLFHPKTILHLIEKAKGNGLWAAIEPFHFWDVVSGEAGVFEGYPSGHQLYKWGMGSGRVFTAKALKVLGQPFAKGNKGMDDHIKKRLTLWDLECEARLLEADRAREAQVPIPIGLKSSLNIWKYKDYRVKSLEGRGYHTDWLPPETQEGVYRLI